MQCIDTDGSEEHFRRIYEDGDEVEDETHGEEEKGKFMQFDMKIRLYRLYFYQKNVLPLYIVLSRIMPKHLL